MIGYEDAEIPNQFQEWETRLHPEDRERALKMVRDYLDGRIPNYQIEYRMRHKNGSYCWIFARGVALRDQTGRPLRFAGSHSDVTQRKSAETELSRLNEELVETSRRAGMAEVTTGVLHNIGNVLNSANVAAAVVKQRIETSSSGNVARVVALLREHSHDLGAFLTSDPKGKLVPDYMDNLAKALVEEKTASPRGDQLAHHQCRSHQGHHHHPAELCPAWRRGGRPADHRADRRRAADEQRCSPAAAFPSSATFRTRRRCGR